MSREKHGPTAITAGRLLLITLVAAAVMLAAQPATAQWPTLAPLVSLDIYDRSAGSTLEVHAKDGQRYVVGTPGHEYSVRIRNNSSGRILAVTSVDGVNVVSGETASPDQPGYVIDAWGSVEIAGWRRSLERTAAFYFTDLGDSYAARTGRPTNVGVVGLAVFREREAAIVHRQWRDKIAADDTAGRERGDAAASSAAALQPGVPQNQGADAANAEGAVRAESHAIASKLGTGFGRGETSYAQRVRFERASDAPAETVAIQYDRRESLIAMGVLPSPRYAQRMPDPFPAMRFVPEPR